MWGLSILRVALCLLPQNQWLTYRQPLLFGVLRNIPFAIMGIIVIAIFARETKKTEDQVFRFILFSGIAPVIGILMIPKTMAYVWIILMCRKLYRQSRTQSQRVMEEF